MPCREKTKKFTKLSFLLAVISLVIITSLNKTCASEKTSLIAHRTNINQISSGINLPVITGANPFNGEKPSPDIHLPTVTENNPLNGDQSSLNINPPVITVTSPDNGDVVSESELTVTFEVFSNIQIKEVFVNGMSLPVSPDGQYSHNIVLESGENLISIIAKDSDGNSSFVELTVGFLSFEDSEDLEGEFEEILELTEELIEELEDKQIINFIEEIGEEVIDLNEAIADLFVELSEGSGELIDITNTVSVEIANAPVIPEGIPAVFELPEIEGIDFFEELEEVFEIPKGFSFATDISFEDFEEPITVSEEDLSKQNTTVLVDANGRTFVVGFAFLRKVEPGFTVPRKVLTKNYRFQTENGEPLELTTTITIPVDATEGDAKVSILNKNESLATIPLRVEPTREVRIGKRLIGKPQIHEPITAIVKKSGKKLSLKIKGKNFIQKIATIDGELQKLLGKTNFTNVTFVPPKGIKVKSIKVRKNSINVNAEIQDNIEPGIKLFNVITPKGADIGAIIFPESLAPGRLETTAVPEEFILE